MDELNGFYNVGRNIFICSTGLVFTVWSTFMYFTQCNISEKKSNPDYIISKFAILQVFKIENSSL